MKYPDAFVMFHCDLQKHVTAYWASIHIKFYVTEGSYEINNKGSFKQ